VTEAQKAVLEERLRKAALAQRTEQPTSSRRLRLATGYRLPGHWRFRAVVTVVAQAGAIGLGLFAFATVALVSLPFN
jgi:hypothetical protein